jgi:tetrahydromethanopterin S-methyltransferase subunit D
LEGLIIKMFCALGGAPSPIAQGSWYGTGLNQLLEEAGWLVLQVLAASVNQSFNHIGIAWWPVVFCEGWSSRSGTAAE